MYNILSEDKTKNTNNQLNIHPARVSNRDYVLLVYLVLLSILYYGV